MGFPGLGYYYVDDGLHGGLIGLYARKQIYIEIDDRTGLFHHHGIKLFYREHPRKKPRKTQIFSGFL